MDANGRRRVVITGIGMVSSLGNDAETSWQQLIAGESGAGPFTQFDSDGYPVHFACELKDFDPTDWVDHKSARRMDRFTQMILAAARLCPLELLQHDRARGLAHDEPVAVGVERPGRLRGRVVTA